MRAWSEHKYGSAFVDGANLGAQLATPLKPQESLFVFGVYPDIYTYAGKPPRRGAINLWLGRADYGYSLSPRLPGRVLTPLKKNAAGSGHPRSIHFGTRHTCRSDPAVAAG